MPPALPASDPAPATNSANAALVGRIVVALQAEDLVPAGETAAIAMLLSSGAAKAGDWANLLRQPISSAISQPSHAPPDNAA